MNAKALARKVREADTLEKAHAAADALLSELRAASTRRNGKRTPSRQAQRREEHKASTGSLREKVAARSEGRCEVSGVELGVAWEMHHLRGGGARRSAQSLDNCIAVSWDVHRLAHRGDMHTLRGIKEACIRLGLRDGLAAIEKRIDKIEAVRGVF